MIRVHHPCSKNAQLKLIEFFLNCFIWFYKMKSCKIVSGVGRS
jgi:hypothetical protein